MVCCTHLSFPCPVKLIFSPPPGRQTTDPTDSLMPARKLAEFNFDFFEDWSDLDEVGGAVLTLCFVIAAIAICCCCWALA